jgi:hypothetical protein
MKSMKIDMRRATIMVLAAVLMLPGCQSTTVTVTREVTRQVEVTVVVTRPAGPEPLQTPSPSSAPGPASLRIEPFLDAPLCPDSGEAHDNSLFHTLWDDQRGCHYDHEHGTNPFTPEVAATFPGFHLRALLRSGGGPGTGGGMGTGGGGGGGTGGGGGNGGGEGTGGGGVEIGSTNPSGPMENTHKHGGMKWQVTIPAPHGCEVGFESGEVAIDAAAIQYHAFGNYSIELESRTHSSVALLRQCKPDNPDDKGYIYTVQLQDYGQRVSGYQGMVMPYPDTPNPGFDSGLAPYFTVDCVHCDAKHDTREDLLAAASNANSIWTSKSAIRIAPSGSTLFALLFRVRDTYQVLDRADVVYPFTFLWLCSRDGGATYDPVDCRYNNSTTTVHEVQGVIPESWDNLPGFDTEPEVGRITAEGYTTRFGELNTSCTTPGPDCHPIKMVRAFVGFYSSELSPAKVANPTPLNTPERDIYFCGGQVCREGDPGAAPSGWIGPNN